MLRGFYWLFQIFVRHSVMFPNLPASSVLLSDKRLLVGCLKENFSDSASVGQIQFDAVLAAGGIQSDASAEEIRGLLLSLLRYGVAFVLQLVMMLIRNWGEEPRDLNRFISYERCWQLSWPSKCLLQINTCYLSVVFSFKCCTRYLAQDLHLNSTKIMYFGPMPRKSVSSSSYVVHIQKDSLLYENFG